MFDTPIYPNAATRTAERAAELRARGFDALAASVEHAHRPVIDWPDTTEPARKRRVWPAVLAILLLLGFAGWFPPSDAHAATPTRCTTEDSPSWSWSECGNLSRGVILKTAPKRCTWDGDWSPRCFAVLDAAEYCHARRDGRIDLKRTRSLKGDKYARDHGCDPALYAQDVQ